MAPPKKKAQSEPNPVTGIRLDPEYKEALQEIADEMNKTNPYAEVTVVGLIRGVIKKFLIEKGKLKA